LSAHCSAKRLIILGSYSFWGKWKNAALLYLEKDNSSSTWFELDRLIQLTRYTPKAEIHANRNPDVKECKRYCGFNIGLQRVCLHGVPL
jgi:hypothetical protein